jgi:phosphoribosyl 1,2-cyclic phosphodiesterase
VLTHAHPDHAYGLADGAPCPVYATKETFDLIGRFPIQEKRRILIGRPALIGGLTWKAFRIHHSMRAPAVGYRVCIEEPCFAYLPDVADLPMPKTALRRVDVYIGDGASMTRTMVRRRDSVLIGHASITVQLRWCKAAGVRRAIFTHCGSGIVRSDARQAQARVRALGAAVGVDARLACDGDRLPFP